MNKNLNDKIKGLITNKEITPNLCLLCLANLNDKINYANRDYSYLEPQRNEIAKVLLNNGMDKEVMTEKIMTIHKECYPTLKGQIKPVYDMIISETYSIVDEQIPEHYIKYKNEQEYEDYMNKPVVYKNKNGNAYSSSRDVRQSIDCGRMLNDLSFEELGELQFDFMEGATYNQIRKTYNLKPYLCLDKRILKVTQDLRDEMLLDSFGWARIDAEKIIDYYNSYSYGIVFWDLERDLESVEDLLEFLNYNDLCFEEELCKIQNRNTM